MTARRALSFRSRAALIVSPDDQERRLLEARLARLGLGVAVESGWGATLTAARADVVFFDVDSGCGTVPERLGAAAGAALIAVVGSETPGRLDWMMQQRPDAHLSKPIRSSGVYTALVMGFHHAGRRLELEARIDRLERRARSRHIVFAATARLMTTQGLTEPAAYRLLRDAAMRHRTTIEQVSARIEADGVAGCAAIAES